MGPPGFMSIYQPVDLMDLTVGMDKWNALSPEMKQFVEMEVHVYSDMRSEEHTSELQSLMRISYAVFCLNKKKTQNHFSNHPNVLANITKPHDDHNAHK